MKTSNTDALNIGSRLSNIQSWKKSQVISCLSTMNESTLKCLLFSVFTADAALKDNKLLDFNEVIACRQHLSQHCNVEITDDHRNRLHLFASLPSMIGGHILSFCAMKDRISHQLVCRDLYKFSRSPNARYHLVVDAKFAKALFNDTLKVEKFYPVRYLDVSFVYRDSKGATHNQEHKYYSALFQIIRKSPSLHTLQYKLKNGFFQNSFRYASPGYGYATYGSFLQWMQNVQSQSLAPNVFHSITTLHFKPSRYQDPYPADFGSVQFCSLLPNLTRCKIYNQPDTTPWSGGRGNQEIAGVALRAISRSNNLTRFTALKSLECDLVTTPAYHWRAGTDAQNSELLFAVHPLAHFHRFVHLKTLKLRLLIFPGCSDYYGRLIANMSRALVRTELNEISVEFKTSDRSHSVTAYRYAVTINEVCRALIRCSPKITKYALITNLALADCNDFFDHLMGVYDRLQSLETDCPGLLCRGIRMMSLQQLTLRINIEHVMRRLTMRTEHIGKMCRNLGAFPHLQVFNVIAASRLMCDNDKFDANSNAISFLQYVMKQRCPCTLKHVGVSHFAHAYVSETDFETKYWKHFDKSSNVAKTSQLLCQALTCLTALPHLTLETIQLNPVVLRHKELQYLDFWFNGNVSTNNEYHLKNMILADIACSQLLESAR